jgi:hypothetical protein
VKVYGVPASQMSLFEKSVLMPWLDGIQISGNARAKEILVVGDLDRTVMWEVVPVILF